jgi:hypothetical protein
MGSAWEGEVAERGGTLGASLPFDKALAARSLLMG